LPDKKGAKPNCAEKYFAKAVPGKLNLAASKSGRDGSTAINQDADSSSANLLPATTFAAHGFNLL
jgi:hypothetical protein